VFKKVLKKLVLATVVIPLAFTSTAQSPAHAQRTIEQAADVLLREVLAVLQIQIVNAELLLELSYEMQYALDTGIIDPDTVKELDIEVLDEDLPDEELFEEDGEIPIEESTDTSSPDSAMTQLSDELKLKLQSRVTLRVTTQVQYWELIAGDWSIASQMAAQEFTTCLDAATTDEESDICYFNEQQQLQFFYAQQLGENYSARLNAANQLGTDVVAFLTQSMTRSQLTIEEALQFMNAEELGTLGLTPNALEDISRKLESQAANAPSGGPPDSTPTSNNPSNGQNQ
jgi:hypothetical protein